MSVTISDIARLANVSKATVSAVLNDRPGISQETRNRVMEIVKSLNYRPSHVARSLSKRTTRSIGLVIKEIDNPFYAKVMKGVFEACSNLGYTVLLGSSELSPTKELQIIETLTVQRVDGLLISPLQGDDVDFTYISELLRENYPLVMLGAVKNYPTNVVEIDNVEAASKAVEYLIEQGHEDIAYFSGPYYSAHSEDRGDGYKRALINCHLPIHPNRIIPAGSYIENGYQKGKELFSNSKSHPSAVLCYNDLVAIGVINAIFELGLQVPEDVSVIGFDDIDFCESFRVPLTTVHIPTDRIGATAAELVIEQIGQREKPLNRKVILDGELVIRDSCAKKD